MIKWLHLYTDQDPHPRRFDCFESAAAYLKKVERLDAQALQVLREEGIVGAPLCTRTFEIKEL